MLYVMICLKYLLHCLIGILKQELSTFAEMGDRARAKSAKKWGSAVPLSVRGSWSPSNSVAWAEAYLHANWHLDPSNHLATIHQHYRQTGQWSRSIGRTVTCNGCPTRLKSKSLHFLANLVNHRH